MDENFAPQQRSAEMDLWHREQARRANDEIRVYNPTDEEFFVTWHPNYRFRFPAQRTTDCPRYIAEKYCRDMVVQIINKMGEEKGNELLEARKKAGQPEFLDKWEENKAIWDRVPKTDDEKEVRKLYPQLWVGLVREFGRDFTTDHPEPGVDIKTTHEKLMGELGSRRVADIASVPTATLVTDTVDDQIEAPLKVVASSDQPFTCPECGRGFKAKIGLMGHTRSHKAIEVTTE